MYCTQGDASADYTLTVASFTRWTIALIAPVLTRALDAPWGDPRVPLLHSILSTHGYLSSIRYPQRCMTFECACIEESEARSPEGVQAGAQASRALASELAPAVNCLEAAVGCQRSPLP